MSKKFSVKTKDSVGARILKRLVNLFKKRPAITYLDGEMDKRCIMIGNHSGAKGAMAYRAFLDNRFMTWGAHQMCEGYKSRWRYLYNIFYQQKLGYGKAKAWISATLFAVVSRVLYGFAGVIPVYYDMRIKRTIKYSFECINNDVAVFVFPENSNDGYKEYIEQMYSGFARLSQMYFNRYKVDLPMYTMYYSSKHNKIVIGKAMYLQQLKLRFDTDQQIAEYFRQYMNSLYTDYILKED